jgi:hypothetical protein
MINSPYDQIERSEWKSKTNELVASHELLGDENKLLKHINDAWTAVWTTTIGSGALAISFRDTAPRAQIVGDFFESLIARSLAGIGWRRGTTTKEKDIVNLNDDSLSFEIKTSGQASARIYGNRSYAQAVEGGDIESTRKSRSGYYLCVNFFGDKIYRVRVGWIDGADWKAQKSETGQMAELQDYVYSMKLVDVNGVYLEHTPLCVVDGVGGTTVSEMKSCGFFSFSDVIERLALDSVPSENALKDGLIGEGLVAATAARVTRSLCRSEQFGAILRLKNLAR